MCLTRCKSTSVNFCDVPTLCRQFADVDESDFGAPWRQRMVTAVDTSDLSRFGLGACRKSHVLISTCPRAPA